MEIVERAVFRVTRDADFEVSDEADDLLEAVRTSYAAAASATSCGSRSPARSRAACSSGSSAGSALPDEQIYLVEGLLDLAELDQLVELDRPELKDEPCAGATPRGLPVRRDPRRPLRRDPARRRARAPPVRLVRRQLRGVRPGGRGRPDVVAMKTTVYRTSDETPARTGPDQRRRGRQAERLPRRAEGALRRAPQHRVVARAGAGRRPCRLRLPEPEDPREDDARRAARGRRARRYVHVGTGNYHSKTARLYEDFGLFTADPDIAADIADLFNYLTGFGRPQVREAPRRAARSARPADRADQSGRAAAAAGTDAHIRIKVNALTDPAVIEELYAASQAGRAGPDRRAQHLHAPPGRPRPEREHPRAQRARPLPRAQPRVHLRVRRRADVYLGSADLMTRNLDHRVEVRRSGRAIARAQAELTAVFDTGGQRARLGAPPRTERGRGASAARTSVRTAIR